MIIVGRTLWGSWTLAFLFSAIGAVFGAFVLSSLPGPVTGATALGVAVVLFVLAGRSFVSVDGDGLTVPSGLGRARIRRGDVAAVTVERAGAGSSAPSVIVLRMRDRSTRRIPALTTYDGLPGGQASMRRAVNPISAELGLSS